MNNGPTIEPSPLLKMDSYIYDEKYLRMEEIERTSKVYTRRMVSSQPKLKILDVGCGTGLNTKYFMGMGHDVIGIDISGVAIERYSAAGFNGIQHDIAKGLEFSDHSFDLIFASEIIEHLIETNLVLREFYRVLRPNGQLVLSTPNSSFWVWRFYALIGKTLSEVQHPGHVRFFSKSSLLEALSSSGFNNVDMSSRKIYLILKGSYFDRISTILEFLRFRNEIRFKTKEKYWHWSNYSRTDVSLFSDTLIVKCFKH